MVGRTVFLEFEIQTKQVVEIHEKEPMLEKGYSYGKSNDFLIGDEFNKTIWIHSIDGEKNLISYSAIRNNPNAKRLLKENTTLKEDLEAVAETVAVTILDVTEVAETSAYTLEDVTALAETLALALMEIESLKSVVSTLKGE